MRSLRKNLMLGIGLAAAVVFVAAGVSSYLLARAVLLSEFDTATHAKARAIASMVELKSGRIRVDELEETHLQEFERAERPEFFEIWTDDGQVLSRSKSLRSGELTRPALSGLRPVTEFVTLPDGRAGREICFRYQIAVEEDEPLGKPQHAIIALARETAPVDHVQARLGGMLVVVSAIAIGAMLFVTALLIRRGLRPVDHLAERITGIGAQNLSERLSATQAPAELTPIVSRLNELLGRLQSAFEREKSFTADAAHELRTPLAGLASALEVCARKDRAPEAYATVVRECLDVVRGMHGMIDNLLMLARADADQIPTNLVPVMVDDLLESAFRRFKGLAENRGLDIEWDVPADLSVETDRDKLLHVLNNLLDNAVCHADAGGQIRISAERNNGDATIRISNSGSRLSSDEAANVFERFWRGDPARSEIGVHCGLGLSVCKKMMAVLRGSIRAESSKGGEFIVEITLPAGKVHPVFMVAT